MKLLFSFILIAALSASAQQPGTAPPSQTPPPASQPPPSNQAQPASPAQAQAPPANPAAPPSAPAPLSQADLEKLVAPLALYPDQLLANILPASAYPLEIVQAARFVKDTNNIANLDQQPWDENVKAVARIPEVINKLNDDIAWTSDLGVAFVNQQKEVMDAIQTMRKKAQQAGTLQTTPQQTVVVTNTVVTNTVEQQPVYVTNEVVQIQPTQPEVVYVPQYNPTTVYAPAPYPAPYYGYTGGQMAAAGLMSFGVGVAVGSLIHNDCDWGHGGVYVGGGWGHGDVNVNRNVNVNQNFNANRTYNQNVNRTGQKWQPDQNRMANAGGTATRASAQARGYGTANTAARQANTAQRQNYTGARQADTAQRQANTGARQADTASRQANTAQRQGNTATRQADTAQRQANTAQLQANAGARQGNTAQRQTPTAGQGQRPTPTGAASGQRTQAASRPTGSSSAFSGGGNASQARAASARGAASRGGGGGGRGGGRR